MSDLMLFHSAVERDPRIEAWFSTPHHELRMIVRPWFEAMRAAGADVRVEEAAFAYVDAFAAHANVGFFEGTSLADPAGLLQGAGKRMRHVKLRWGEAVHEAALAGLISAAYRDMHERLRAY
jgi:hypothetical protein